MIKNKYLLLLFIIILLLALSCQDKHREQDIERSFEEVVYIGAEQYITVDSRGNIHHITPSGEDKTIISFQDIEQVLNREFTKADVNKSSK